MTTAIAILATAVVPTLIGAFCIREAVRRTRHLTLIWAARQCEEEAQSAAFHEGPLLRMAIKFRRAAHPENHQ